VSEKVQRVRATQYDENNDPIPGTGDPVELTAKGVAPGASVAVEGLGRNGEKVDFTVFFLGEVDLTDDDELIIRGRQYGIRVLDWRSGYNTGRRGLQVLASLGRG
jgi:hypothetical protein